MEEMIKIPAIQRLNVEISKEDLLSAAIKCLTVDDVINLLKISRNRLLGLPADVYMDDNQWVLENEYYGGVHSWTEKEKVRDVTDHDQLYMSALGYLQKYSYEAKNGTGNKTYKS